MRQLKGKVKETKKEKRERKADNLKNKDKVWTVVLPVILTISVIIIAYVLLSTKALWFKLLFYGQGEIISVNIFIYTQDFMFSYRDESLSLS